MCGIAGIIGLKNVLEDGRLLHILACNLAHRGPDDEGRDIVDFREQQQKALGLVHRRLSIIDLSAAGHQPMLDSYSGNKIVFNGEIYNFRDVRRDLEHLGYDFTSDSDTEVILKAYGQWGIACLERLRGMFAFAIWDNVAQKLVLVVDRLGIKPLYYYTGPDGTFLFASELRALLATGLVPGRIDAAGLESYLAYGAMQAPLTIIKDVQCLLPGHYAVVHSNGQIEIPRKYWSPPFAGSDSTNRSEVKSIEDLRELLENIVQYHLVSDVPVGIFLSGGIDSSSLVALVSQVASEPPLTFSVTFPEAEFSEAPYSRLIAQMYKTQHTEIHLTENRLLQLLPGALESMDQPTIDGVNVYVISQVVRAAGLKAILSGQGGDETLTGYPTYKYIQTFARYRQLMARIPLPLRRRLGDLWCVVARQRVSGHKLSELLRTDGNLLSAYLILRTLFLPSARRALLNCDLASQLKYGLPETVAVELQEMGKELDYVNQVSLFELRTYLANMLLRDGDFMSMAHGLEVRVPYLDHKLVEFVAQIPGRLKLDAKLPKPLLIKAMGDLLPPAIYQRPKAGFTFPWEYWLRNQLRPQVTEVFESKEIGQRIGLNPDFCQELWQRFLRHAPGLTWSRVWSLFVLYMWCERHGVSAG